MARAIWTGVLSFGLVTVPVGLFTATEDHTTHFHQLQRDTSDRVRNRRVNERTGREVANDEIVKGYEFERGEYVVVEPEELDDIAPGRSQAIEITDFVDLDQIEPVYFDRTYYLAPSGDEYQRVYDLLCQALESSHRAGIATFVLRNKQYLTAIRAEGRVLVLHTLHWADEVRDPDKELPRLPERRASRGRELDTAVELIDAMTTDWHPTAYHDDYEKRVHELVEAKAEGREIVGEAEPPKATDVVDLMDALRGSIEQSRGGGGTRRQKPGRQRRREGTRRGGGKASGGKESGGKRAAGASRDLARLSKDELYQRASDLDVSGRSRMSRDQLIDALSSR